MNGWHVKVRYARSSDLTRVPVEDWREQAARAVNLMDG